MFTAAGPDWRPVRLTNNTEDDGVDMSSLDISDDGSTVLYQTGHGNNRDQQVGNQGHDALGGQRVLWAVPTAGGVAPWRVMQLTDRTEQGAVLPATVAVAPAANEKQQLTVVRVLTEFPNNDGRLKSNLTGYAKIGTHNKPVWKVLLWPLIRWVMVEVWSWIP